MVTIVRGAAVITPGDTLRDHDVVIEDGIIAAITEHRRAVAGDTLIDVPGGRVIPGLIDPHVHGGGGFDTLDATPEAFEGMGRFMARHGVTSYLGATITASRPAIDAAVAAARAFVAASGSVSPTGARLRGLHLEGPYLSESQAGAQPLAELRDPAPEEYGAWFASGVVKVMTVAPERAGMEELFARAVLAGVRLSIGHSAASSEVARWAIEHGATQCTHTFSGMPGLEHRNPGILSTCLGDERLVAEMIADGIHIHPEIVNLLVRIKGPERVMLVTDAIRAAGLGDGRYVLGGVDVEVRDGVTRRPHDGGLAGSTLTLDQALRNVMRYADLTLADALPMATTVPAQAMGWGSHAGTIEAGRDADLAVLGPDLGVLVTIVGGTTVHDGRRLPAAHPQEGGGRD